LPFLIHELKLTSYFLIELPIRPRLLVACLTLPLPMKDQMAGRTELGGWLDYGSMAWGDQSLYSLDLLDQSWDCFI